MTKIQWTDQTWNPIVGCEIVSSGCTNCYAMKMAWRLGHNPKTPQYHGLTEQVNGNAVWTGAVRLAENALLQPLKRKKPTKYFVNSMGDLFHENVPDEWIDRVFAVMALCPQHTFQVLTKRPERMRAYLGRDYTQIRICSKTVAMAVGELRFSNQAGTDDWWPLPNVWLGVSVENQTTADERIPQLLNTPAALRFISAEPLLGPVDLNNMVQRNQPGEHHYSTISSDVYPEDDPWGGACIDWVICGGESGASARPMHPDWARSLRDQCAEAGVPFWFKQWGEWGPIELPASAARGTEANLEMGMMRWGKAQTGNLIDGVTYEQMPEVQI